MRITEWRVSVWFLTLTLLSSHFTYAIRDFQMVKDTEIKDKSNPNNRLVRAYKGESSHDFRALAKAEDQLSVMGMVAAQAMQQMWDLVALERWRGQLARTNKPVPENLAISAVPDRDQEKFSLESRPKMVVALVMDITAEPEAKIYIGSSLRGVNEAGYNIEPPLHPALVSTFQKCKQDAIELAKTQGTAVENENDPSVRHNNDLGCAEVFAMNRWLNEYDQTKTIPDLKKLKEILTAEPFKGNKRIITVTKSHKKAADVRVASPCSPDDIDAQKLDKSWGCKTWLTEVGFETCEIGWDSDNKPADATVVTIATTNVQRRTLAERLVRRTGEQTPKAGKQALKKTSATSKTQAGSGAGSKKTAAGSGKKTGAQAKVKMPTGAKIPWKTFLKRLRAEFKPNGKFAVMRVCLLTKSKATPTAGDKSPTKGKTVTTPDKATAGKKKAATKDKTATGGAAAEEKAAAKGKTKAKANKLTKQQPLGARRRRR